MIMKTSTTSALLVAAVALLASQLELAQAKSLRSQQAYNSDDSVSAVIPSPEQVAGSDEEQPEVMRREPTGGESAAAASNEAAVPVYVSPFVRAERSLSAPLTFDPQESSHAPPNYAPRPSASAASLTKDLKTSASYGHHHGGYHGGHHGGHYDHSGWLDMGAWTGGKGSFGWYADYPVGGKHHGYGRK